MTANPGTGLPLAARLPATGSLELVWSGLVVPRALRGRAADACARAGLDADRPCRVELAILVRPAGRADAALVLRATLALGDGPAASRPTELVHEGPTTGDGQADAPGLHLDLRDAGAADAPPLLHLSIDADGRLRYARTSLLECLGIGAGACDPPVLRSPVPARESDVV